MCRRSSVSSAWFATTFTRFGRSVSAPTVATIGGPISSASRRSITAISAATSPASWRSAIGVVPAWFDTPESVTSVHEIPCTPVTAPIVTPS